MSQTYPHEIDVHAVHGLLQEGESLLLVDCREPDEWDWAHIQQAQSFPMSTLVARLPELQPYRDQRIIVYCHVGVRSQQVCHWLRAQGFQQVQNMDGGIDRWSLLIDPSLPRY